MKRNIMMVNFLLFLSLFILNASFCPNSIAKEFDFEVDSRLPIVNINVAIKSGSVTDPEGQIGLTNFMGEMLLRGTQARNKEQIDMALDQMGARLEVETRAEALILRGEVMSSQLDPYLSLLTEIITQPKFPQQEIRKLKEEIISVIQEEMGHDSSLISRKFAEFLFLNHPYGKPILGKIQDIENLNFKKVQDHYQTLFQDPLMIVVGSGDAQLEKLSHWANQLSGLLPRATSIPAQKLEKVSIPQNFKNRRVFIVDKPERSQTQIDFGQVGIQMTDSNFFPLYLGNYAFGGPSFSSTLMQEIRVKRGWSYGANSSFRFGRQPRSWQVHLFPAAKDTAQALVYSLKLAENLKQSGLTLNQFEFAKESLMKSSGFMYNTPAKRVENKLLEKTLNLPDGFMKSYGTELKKVNFQAVNNALKEFLKPDQMAVVVLGTASELKPALAQELGIAPNEIQVVPYTQE